MRIHITFYISAILNTDIFQVFSLSKSTLRLHCKCCTASSCDFCFRKISYCVIFAFRLLQGNAGIPCICYCNCLLCRYILVSFFRRIKFQTFRINGKIIYRLWFCYCKNNFNSHQFIAINIFHTDLFIVITCCKTGFRLKRKCSRLSRIDNFC